MVPASNSDSLPMCSKDDGCIASDFLVASGEEECDAVISTSEAHLVFPFSSSSWRRRGLVSLLLLVVVVAAAAAMLLLPSVGADSLDGSHGEEPSGWQRMQHLLQLSSDSTTTWPEFQVPDLIKPIDRYTWNDTLRELARPDWDKSVDQFKEWFPRAADLIEEKLRGYVYVPYRKGDLAGIVAILELQNLQYLFKDADSNNDGILTVEEMKALMPMLKETYPVDTTQIDQAWMQTERRGEGSKSCRKVANQVVAPDCANTPCFEGTRVNDGEMYICELFGFLMNLKGAATAR